MCVCVLCKHIYTYMLCIFSASQGMHYISTSCLREIHVHVLMCTKMHIMISSLCGDKEKCLVHDKEPAFIGTSILATCTEKIYQEKVRGTENTP